MARYKVQLVHKIAPRLGDDVASVELPDGAFADCKTLGAALRKAPATLPYPGLRTVLAKGERIGSFRVEAGKVVAFPIGSIWHSIILEVES
jgi:hypothetical protein